MKLKTAPISFLILALFLSLTLVGGQVDAQSVDEGGGLDLIFLVDQSGTMGGQAFKSINLVVEENDPHDLRFAAPLFAMDWLARAYLEYGPEPGTSIRAGVVYFGATADFAPGLEELVEIAPDNPGAWDAQYRDLASKLTPQALAGDEQFFREKTLWCCTDFVAAFRKAKAILDSGDPGENRTKAIIVLSDGLPDPRDERDYSQRKMDALMAQVEAEVLGGSGYDEFRIDIVAFDNLGNPSWYKVEESWDRIANGSAELVGDNRTLGAELQEVLSEVVAPVIAVPEEDEIKCGQLQVPPLLRSIHFTIHKPDPARGVRIYDPTGADLTGVTADALTEVDGQEVLIRGDDAPIESIEIRGPRPGVWRVACPSGEEALPRLFLRESPSEIQLTMDQSSGAQFVPLRLSLHFLDYYSGYLPRQGANGTAVQVSGVARGGGESLDLSFTRVETDTETWQADLTPHFSDEYSVKVWAAVQQGDVMAAEMNFWVQPSVLGVRLDQQMTTIGVPLTAQAGFLNEGGELRQISSDAGLQVFLQVTHTLPEEPIPLQLSSKGIYTIDYLAMSSGEYQLDVFGVHTSNGAMTQIVSDGPASFTVVQPQLKDLTSDKKLIEDRPSEIFVVVTDYLGNPYSQVLEPTLGLSVEAMSGDQGTAPVPMQELGQGRFIAEITPAHPGELHLSIQATLHDADGTQYVCLSEPLAARAVTPYLDWLLRQIALIGSVSLLAGVGLFFTGRHLYLRDRNYDLGAKLWLRNDLGDVRSTSLLRTERTFDWLDPGAPTRELSRWDECLVKKITITHWNGKTKEPKDRVVRVDVWYHDRKLPRSYLLMLHDEPEPLHRAGMEMELCWEEDGRLDS